MSTEETVSRSPLDKPLHLLTEEDISQLTREDCRRFLKEKGTSSLSLSLPLPLPLSIYAWMRRPSWNKSQAIQQVISLKTLLETSSDSDAVTRKKLPIPRPDNLHRVHRSTGSAPLIVPAEESPACRRKDPERNDRSDHGRLVDGSDSSPPSCLLEQMLSVKDYDPHTVFIYDNYSEWASTAIVSGDCDPWTLKCFPRELRTAGAANGPLGQMTIFYCGKVNVYDDVPVDKAQALMQLAASPLQVPLEVPFDGSAARRPLPCHLQAASGRVGPDTPVVILPTQAVNMSDNCWPSREESGICREENTDIEITRLVYFDLQQSILLFLSHLAAEVPGSRKASVQRYLEKRKDRFKSKRKVATPPSASLDVYLNPQMGNQTQNERSNRSDACSSPQIRPPNTPTRSSSADDNLVKSTNFPAGLNEKDMRE
ncbi:hypothetical protein RHSIM_Rhsim13G0028400 [Rhododendron simsii]|uniref:Protein TIFY n=1 Tax=Rhododendron simsii TaxID=118357 RepID=A0A834L3J2_RHOSS|nr:hypothetical protein RHSIM_Rhsim13G0028400 [Rhododendron simsii]